MNNFLTKKDELRSAIAALFVHVVFFVVLAILLDMNPVKIEQPRFIQLRLGSSTAVNESVVSQEKRIEELPQNNLLQVQKTPEKNLPELGVVEEKLQIEVKEKISQKPRKVSVSTTQNNEVAGSEYGNSSTGQKSATYLELLQLTVQETSQIPTIAREKKIGGDAILRLTFNRAGYVRDFKLVKKTGYKILDDAAIEVAKKLVYQPFPPMPANFEQGKEKVTYDFPISFKP